MVFPVFVTGLHCGCRSGPPADRAIAVFRLPGTSLTVVVLLEGLTGTLAAALPSRRAVRLDALRAFITEYHRPARGSPCRVW